VLTVNAQTSTRNLELTPRMVQVQKLVDKGLTTRDIANILGLSTQRVHILKQCIEDRRRVK
jgi:DNA-binding NarL/FixJ family response regulator